MTPLVAKRLVAQQLVGGTFRKPEALVAWMGAIQAQDYLSARWAVGIRLAGAATEEEVERAIAEGRIIRTHAFRGTWQLIAPEDVRWMTGLVRSRVRQRTAGRHRELGLDARTLARASAVVTRAVERNGPRTREELAAALKAAKISPEGQRLPHVLGHIELEGLICGGPRRGQQFTWTLLETKADRRSEDEALAELAVRFFHSRGPATADDFAWWAGLNVTDARRAIDLAGKVLSRSRTAGRELFQGADAPMSKQRKQRSWLLPGFDEWLVGYRDRSDVLDPKHRGPVNQGGGIIGMCVVVDGRVVGIWKRTLVRRGVSVDVKLWDCVDAAALAEINAAMDRYAAFLGLPIVGRDIRKPR